MKIKKSELKNLSQTELLAIARKLGQVDEVEKRRTLEKYLETANPGQLEFHKAKKRIMMLCGGNRSGKSTGGVVEDLWRCLGTHPFRKNKIPVKGLVVLQDYQNHCKNIFEPKLDAFAPAGSVVGKERNQQQALTKIRFGCGSTLDILSHDQDIKVFEGSDYDFCHFDEPPPKKIFNAVWRGLLDRGGDAYITATPIVEPWLYQLYKRGEQGDPLIWYRFMDTEENAKNLGEGDAELGKKRIQEFAATLSEDEKEARLHGKFLQMQGLIFKDFKRSHHLIPPFPWPREWEIWESIDPHPQKPWAVSWIGITENNTKILLRSGLFDGVIDEIAAHILSNREEIEMQHGRKPRITRCVIDNYASVPLMSRSYTDPTARRKSVREELEALIGPMIGGPPVTVAPKNVKSKIELFKQWIHINSNGKSEFYAFNCSENDTFVDEIENYIWDTKRGGILNGMKDQPKKEKDDILDTIMQVALTLPSTKEAPEIIRIPMGNSYR